MSRKFYISDLHQTLRSQGRDSRPLEKYVKLWEKEVGMAFKAANVGCMMPYMDYTPRTLEEIKKAKGWN